MLIATAGHVDHGKTELVRALTGIETDRLPEEQARGISIDLGFAHWRPDAGAAIGFVDVPGHERFVRNMLAGISGAEFALLVVAADDGVMPQTAEHLRMLDLLGIAQGAVVLTKCDRAAPQRIAAVRAQIAELLAGTGLADAPLFEASSVSGAGIDRLAQHLLTQRERLAASADETHGFRLAIDRAFTVSGAGTVVTGTVISGSVADGSELTISPSGRKVRVRGLQGGGARLQRIDAGQRGALNLAGAEVSELHRGDWLVDPARYAPTTRIEARLLAHRSLRHDSRVHLHIGAADIGARVLIPRQRALPPGEAAIVHLLLDSPTSAATGQRFVLRDQSGTLLIGGGSVLDPLADIRRRPLAMRQAMAEALALSDPAAALGALAVIPGFEPDAVWFARCTNLLPPALRQIIDDGDFICAGKSGEIVIARSRFDRLGAALLQIVGQFHRDQPDAGGIIRRQLRQSLAEPVSAELFASLLQDLAAKEKIDASRTLLCLPGHAVSFNAAEIALWNSVLQAYEDGPPRGFGIADLARELRSSEAVLRALLLRRRASGDVWQVTETKFMLRTHVAALAAMAAQLDQQHDGFKPAQFRDASGIGRNFVIQLLEFFDRIGVTKRFGETRRMWKRQLAGSDQGGKLLPKDSKLAKSRAQMRGPEQIQPLLPYRLGHFAQGKSIQHKQ